MESAQKLIILILWLCLFFTGCMFEKRFVSRLRKAQQHLQHQIDNLRTELKTEINMLREDVNILFDSHATTTTVVPGVRKKVSDKSFQAAKHDESKALLYVQILAKAFAFEKTINQKLRKEFYKLKETMTHQLEDQKRGYERDIAKLSSEVQEYIATWKEKSAAAILNETTIVESRCKSLYEEAKNSLKTFQIYQKHRFDNTTAMIKTNAETYKSELNLRIQTVREGMQDNIDEHCIIPLS